MKKIELLNKIFLEKWENSTQIKNSEMNARAGKPESSTLSRSQSLSNAADISNRNAIISGTYSLIDRTFPLFDEIQKFARIPPFIYQLLILFHTIQMISTSYWPGLKRIHDYEGTCGKVVKILCQIGFFNDLSGSDRITIIGFVVLTVLFVIIILTLVFQLIIYSQNRRFIRWTLFPTRFIIEFAPLIMICPVGLYLGELFLKVVYEKTTLAITCFVFGLIYMAFIVFIQYVFSFIFSASPYISTAPTATWSGSFYFVLTANFGLWPLLSGILSIFADYYSMVLIALKLAVNVYMFIRLKTIPIVQISINAVICGIFTVTSVLDVVSLVRLCGVKIDYMYDLIITVSVLLVSVVIFKFIFTRLLIRLKKQLSYSALEKIPDEEVPIDADQYQNPNQLDNSVLNSGRGNNNPASISLSDAKKRYLFQLYGIDKSAVRAQMYMRIGLAEHADLFIDWSLVKYVAEFYQSTQMFCVITRFISYFPSESRLLNYFFVQTVVRSDLTFYHRYLLYEVHRVKGLRQSSASSEITDKLMELKRMTQSCITTTQDFWKNIPNDPSIFYDIRSSTKRVQALFNEAIDKWPNNVRLCEDYSKFLIECATDFTAGIKMKHRADLIEQGKNFIVDISFRSLIKAYPMYLKRNIVDFRGNFTHLKATGAHGSSASSSNANSQLSTGTIDGELDLEIEEQLAKTNFNHHRVRLAYQRSLVDRRSPNSQRLKCSAFWTLFLGLAILIFSFVFFYSIFDSREFNLERQFTLNQARYGYDAAFANLIFYWIKHYGGIDDDTWKKMSEHETSTQYGINLEVGARNDSIKWNVFGTDALSLFMDSVVDRASKGDDIFNIMGALINSQLVSLTCLNSETLKATSKTSLKDELAYLFLQLRTLTFRDNVADWYNSTEMCEIIVNIPNMAEVFETLQESMAVDQTAQKKNTDKTLFNIIIPVSIGYFLLTEPLLFIFLTKMLRELNYLLELMKSVDDQSKNEASNFFKRELETEDTNDRLAAASNRGISSATFYFSIFLPIIILIGIFIGVVFLTYGKNASFLNLSSWMTLGVSRANLMIETVAFTALSMAIPKIIPTDIITKQRTIELSQGLVTMLSTYNNILLRGIENLPPCVGQNERFDQINFEDTCQTNGNTSNIHDTYKCFALDRAISYFQELSERIFNNIDQQTFDYDSNFYHLYHIVNSHMADKSYEAAQLLSSLAEYSISSFRSQLAILCFGGIAINILGFFVFWSELVKMDVAYEGALQLMRRLSPPSVVSNISLLNYLLNRSNEKVSNKMTTSMSIIHMSKDSVICLNRNESIEVVNQSISSLFGYTPEQLLGQPISTILPSTGAEEIFNHFNLMRLGQCAMQFETNTYGITDDEQEIPVHLTILGICDNNSGIAKSFAVIFRDETQLQKQRNAAEEAKAQSEKLLYQILPRDIVSRLNASETDISFSVPSASIIFVDIVKFSDYSSTLTPTQIMENLSTIFARFDTLCAKFPLMTKIKLIGDVYMAASGLFTPQEPVANHASQTVQFGLDVIVALEEVNSQLDSSLQVRVGVNTDGPLIAGVLGTDKPLFDIIGDPINVSSRLQSTCIPGTVQISQTTYDAIRDLNFNIEQRGEIVLKGKGKKMAYIVRAFPTGSFFMQDNMQSDDSQQITPSM
ncbi:Adenylate and Guanylate cyclase catalytic domain containing protein [Tritrichomonas foetus]|uniref:Adenylate and Guanylate cyclase catalytic domain containing protein n=1 Tax=Tritrichomonas foetus TaxID=1144522 RepID=A0A1J4KD41_9EUKA|nr:Adenylate and Guanylate cyclase catalytic domain containing protein [Tritrichomonas foetus]|eukprot:OHT07620.1 Adenylate and Guanylate cyclase catalytic domain containing protein [Tritrichomonas foetus]